MAKRLMAGEFILAQGEWLLESGRDQIGANRLTGLVKGLITVYNNIFEESRLRQHAAEIVAKLAKVNLLVLELIFKDAQKYVCDQHIDDAFPYRPNSFEVLGLVGPGNPLVVVFLEGIVNTNWGIPRWAAIEALCVLNDATADEILKEIVLGNYSPRNLDPKDDLRIIEKYKGKGFKKSIL